MYSRRVIIKHFKSGLADLKRHHKSRHAPNRPEFFCNVDGCSRSKAGGNGIGGRTFTRKDKLEDHVRAVHLTSM